MDLFRPEAAAMSSPLLGPPMTTLLQPASRTGDPAAGLRAEVWDPLWLLGRQWQVGEFAGEDTGTPLSVRVTARVDPLGAWRPGPPPAAGADPEWLPLPDLPVLEELVDGEARRPEEGRALAMAAWTLSEALGDLQQRGLLDVLHTRFPATAPATEPPAPPGAADTAVVVDPWTATAAVLGGRMLDAAAVAQALAGARPAWWAAAVTGTPRRRVRVEEVTDDWLAWFAAEVAPGPTPSPGAGVGWDGARLEHAFSLATAREVLHAPAHGGGSVSWSTLDLLPDGVPPSGDAEPVHLDRTLLATPLHFPGMPASRFWEMEDARVDLGAVWADPHELARLLVVECALVHGGDWLVLPLDVPAPRGCVVRLESVTWTDTFESTWIVGDAVDPAWRMYAVSAGGAGPDGGPGSPVLDGLLVCPPEGGRLEGPPLEEVGFVRDETANLVWAVEHRVPAYGGGGVVPRPAPAPAPRTVPPPAPGEEPVLAYALTTRTPDTWTPYLPRVGPDGVMLLRGTVRRWDEAGPTDLRATGTLVPAADHRVISSAEVPREGVRVLRVPVVARRADGTWATWTARRAEVGRGEVESGLRHDQALPPRRSP